MGMGRPMPPLILDDTERETLERWVRRPKTAQGLALRARMILACRRRPQQHRSGCRLGGVRQKRWGSGVPGSWNGDWTACRTSPAAADRERLLMKTWNG